MREETRAQKDFIDRTAWNFVSLMVFPPEDNGDVMVFASDHAKSSYHLPPSKALRTKAVYRVAPDGSLKETS